MILPIQCRMARTALEMDIADLAKLAGLSTNPIVRFERGEQAATVDRIRAALEAAGVVFIPENGWAPVYDLQGPELEPLRSLRIVGEPGLKEMERLQGQGRYGLACGPSVIESEGYIELVHVAVVLLQNCNPLTSNCHD